MNLESHWAATGMASALSRKSVSLWLSYLYCEKRNLVLSGVQIFLALTSGLITKDISHGGLVVLFLIVPGNLGSQQKTLVT